MKNLKNALKALGLRNKYVTVQKHDFATVDVYLDGAHFGIWDLVKNNFVA